MFVTIYSNRFEESAGPLHDFSLLWDFNCNNAPYKFQKHQKKLCNKIAMLC